MPSSSMRRGRWAYLSDDGTVTSQVACAGGYPGKLERRAYACSNCEGYHLTSNRADEYESKRSRKHAERCKSDMPMSG